MSQETWSNSSCKNWVDIIFYASVDHMIGEKYCMNINDSVFLTYLKTTKQ